MRVLSEADYAQVPWKNGAGTTTDLLMLPPGATHDSFDIRISRSPIMTEGPFSSFPGIDRRITLVQGERLDLTFDDRMETLRPFAPLTFDSVLTPHSGLPFGAVQVINVMTRRGVWTSMVEALAGPWQARLAAGPGELVLIYAAKEGVRAREAGRTVPVAAGETLLLEHGAAADIALDAQGRALLARLTPAVDRPG